ncbi:hypothetical protein FA10DRAFT_268175 [Acaromyces ingoldii]|uniref:ABM domain-containing protein n=1 Tax=Acaromyces ingoldii TaxID=215250 RepID=A0A316YPH6_9BASI|nr:hypothetical protein FA10DRAFT_268175 [Acaromyces ingoldii]PWN89645.1 hypothetical protein FA10DRAFT_268175 [Acaromyces ingoldii]
MVYKTNDLGNPPEGHFFLVVHLQGKDKKTADELFSTIKAVEKVANSDREPDTLTYQVSRSEDDGETILVYEEYPNKAALDHHKAQPEFQKFAASFQPLIKDINVRYYRKD